MIIRSFFASIISLGSITDILLARCVLVRRAEFDWRSQEHVLLMSALPPKADMCSAQAHVCFGPKADVDSYSITSSARTSNWTGISILSATAVLRFSVVKNLVGCWMGSSLGFAPFKSLST